MTLVDILERPPGDPEAVKARAGIMKKGTVPLILAKQEEGGYWDQPDRLYVAKYKGTGSTDDAANFVCSKGFQVPDGRNMKTAEQETHR